MFRHKTKQSNCFVNHRDFVGPLLFFFTVMWYDKTNDEKGIWHMSLKKSRFNFIYKRAEDEVVIYNTFSKALVVLAEEEYGQFLKDAYTEDEVRDTLMENGILVEESFDEMGFLKYFHYKTKFSNDTLFLTIAPTLDCNFACPYCYENRRQGRMSQEVQDGIIAFIEDTVESGAKTIDISWYGGEPLLYPDIVESLSERILKLAKEKDCILKMHMVTNGYLLTEEIVEMLDRIGVTRIQITLDGMKENHDVRRPLRNGKGTFEQIFENLRLFDDSPIAVVIRMNVDRQNAKDFKRLKEAIEELENPNIGVYASPVEDINKDTVNEVSDFMTTEEFDAFTMQSCDEGGLSSNDFAVMDDRYCFCTAETENCYVVDDRGDFYKCWDEVGRREHRCFNILDSENVNYSVMAHYLSSDPFADEKCKDCVFLPLCFGGCKFQKANLKKSVCGFTEETLKKYIETAFFK